MSMEQRDLSAREKRRIFLVLTGITAIFAFLAGKLFWIQLASPQHYSSRGVNLVKNSVLQRQHALVLQSGRGEIYDRHMQPLTGNTVKALAVFPNNGKYKENAQQITQIANILQTTPEAWKSFTKDLQVPKLWGAGSGETPAPLNAEQERKLSDLQLPHLRVVEVEERYSAGMTARQLIGFIGENPDRVMDVYSDDVASGKLAVTSKIGGAGLEKTFEPWLRGIGETSISYFTDAAKRPLSGLDARMVTPDNSYYPLKLVTTLDAGIQQKVEALMDKLHIGEGAAVVLSAEQGDVVAMASRPNFDPEHVDLNSRSWSNHAVKAVAPGSIFKTVVAAAALEEGVVDPHETFDCEGELGKYGFTCWLKEGHGSITMEEGFAESCNIVFAKVMQRLTSQQLETYARRLGLLSEAGWSGTAGTEKNLHQFDAEEAGQLFANSTPHEDEGVLMQTAIGQRDVLVTPLQAANMIVTLLHGGKGFEPRVVQEIQYKTDQMMEKFPPKKLTTEGGRISESTSRTLLAWMEEVVTDGTGKGLQSAKWKLAGKSGTAQIQTGTQEKVNQWFIGYGPVESPKYAVSVVVENRSASAENKSIPLFKGIMDILADASNGG